MPKARLSKEHCTGASKELNTPVATLKGSKKEVEDHKHLAGNTLMQRKEKKENKILPLRRQLCFAHRFAPFHHQDNLRVCSILPTWFTTSLPRNRIFTSPPCAQETKIKSLPTFKGKGAKSNQACSSKPVSIKSPLALVKGDRD